MHILIMQTICICYQTKISSTGARDFSLLQQSYTGSVAHPASISVGTGALSPGQKVARV